MNGMYAENMRMAWQSLLSNKMRSLLTMLGIIIGVASVIALVSVGFGVQKSIEDRISRLGSNLMIVFPGAPKKPGHRHNPADMQSLTYKDYLAVSRLPNVEDVSPMVRGSYVVVSGNSHTDTRVVGVKASYLKVRDIDVEEGRIWTPQEEKSRARVALLSKKVSEDLFGDADPIGNKIRINNDPFVVIGMVKTVGSNDSTAVDDRILVPFSTVQERLLGITHIHNMSVKAKSPEVMPALQADITHILRVRHAIPPDREDNFTIENMTDILETMQETTRTLTLFLGAVAAISLLVGGIGIMNIMLVSVTERTREIGIRKALGATYHMIITQFLIEAITISLVGGAIGIVFGIVAAKAITALADIPTVITLLPILGAFLFSMLIGLIFGMYPARKAARLNPIDALHYE